MPTLIEHPAVPQQPSQVRSSSSEDDDQNAILPPEMSPAELTLSFGGVEFTLNPSDIEAEVSFKNNGKGILLSLENFSGSLQVSLKKKGGGPGAAAATSTVGTTTTTKLATVEEEPSPPRSAPKTSLVSSGQQRLPFPKQGGKPPSAKAGGKARMRRKPDTTTKPPPLKERKRTIDASTKNTTSTKPTVKKTRVEAAAKIDSSTKKTTTTATPPPPPAAFMSPRPQTLLGQTMEEAVESTQPTQTIADLSQTMDTSQSGVSRSGSGNESSDMFQAVDTAASAAAVVGKSEQSVTEILNRINNSNNSVATVQGDEECNSIASRNVPDGETTTDIVVEQQGNTTDVMMKDAAPDGVEKEPMLSPTENVVVAASTPATKMVVNPISPCPRWGHTMTTLEDNLLLVYGGQSFDLNGNPNTLSDIHFYDPSKRTWTKPINSRGEARQWHSSTYVPHRKLLITFGGETWDPIKSKTVTSDSIRVFDKEISLWFPPSVSGMCIMKFIGHTLFLNAFNFGSLLTDFLTCFCLSPLFYLAGDVPSGRSGHTLTHLPETNELILFGGVKGSKWLNNLSVLDTSSWIWSVPKVHGFAPKARSYHSATAVKGKNGSCKLVIIGGNNKTSSFNSVHVLEINEEGWRWTHPSVSGQAPLPRTGHSASLLEDGKTINVYGGWDPNEEEDGGDCIYNSSFLLDTETWTWKSGPKAVPGGIVGTENDSLEEDCGPKRCGHTAALNHENGEVIVFGGRIPGERLAGDFQHLPSALVGLNESTSDI